MHPENGFICFACGEKGSLSRLAQMLELDVPAECGQVEITYDYLDQECKLLFQQVRLPGKNFRFRHPNGKGGWIWNLKGVTRVLYKLPDLIRRKDETVFIVEGEKDADRLLNEGLLATTNPGGAGKWRKEYNQILQGRNVVIIPDNDDPGLNHALKVAQFLFGTASSVKVVKLSGLPPKGDVSDWFDSAHTKEELIKLVSETGVCEQDKSQQPSEGYSETKENQAERLINLILENNVDLFHDERNEPYARLQIGSRKKIISLDSGEFKNWAARLSFQVNKKALSSVTLNSAIQVLAGKALYEGQQHKLHVRLAKRDNVVWIDLDGSRAVKIQSGRWEVIEDPPILFRSLGHQKPLPDPDSGGNLKEVLDFFNLKNEHDKLLLLCFLVAVCIPDIPIPVLVISGIQGSGKSTLAKICKRLLDPAAVDLQGPIQKIEDFALSAFTSRVLAFDNLDVIPGWLSDAICRTVTGEGFMKRRHYTNEDLVTFTYKRAMVLTGINLVAQKSDLLDRSLIIELDSLQSQARLDEEEFWRRFEESKATIFGGILNTVSKAMEIRPGIELSRNPRMADFAKWGAAIAISLGYSLDDFERAYGLNVERQNSEAINASPVAQAVIELLKDQCQWEGTPSDLLEALNMTAERLKINTSTRGWPGSPSYVTRRLNEAIPNLGAIGIEIKTARSSNQRNITIIKTSEISDGGSV